MCPGHKSFHEFFVLLILFFFQFNIPCVTYCRVPYVCVTFMCHLAHSNRLVNRQPSKYIHMHGHDIMHICCPLSLSLSLSITYTQAHTFEKLILPSCLLGLYPLNVFQKIYNPQSHGPVWCSLHLRVTPGSHCDSFSVSFRIVTSQIAHHGAESNSVTPTFASGLMRVRKCHVNNLPAMELNMSLKCKFDCCIQSHQILCLRWQPQRVINLSVCNNNSNELSTSTWLD